MARKLTKKELFGLEAAYKRKQQGKATEEDIKNLDYAQKKGLWSPEQPSVLPEGAVPIPGAVYNTREKQTAAFDKITPIGNTLYGVPKEQLAKIEEAINANQEADYQNKLKESEPPIRGKFEQYKELLDTGAPKLTSFADLYEQYISGQKGEQYKTTDLENELNYWQEQKAKTEQRLRDRIAYEESQPVALGVIQGKTSEIRKQEMRNLEDIDRHLNSLRDQLKTRYAMIDTLMKAAQLDYQNAVDYYDRQFKNNLNILNFVNKVEEQEKTWQERERDNARVNLQTIINSISKGLLTNLDEDTKLQIRKLEMQAGLPAGFTDNIISNLQKQNQGGEILFNNTRTDPSGNKYLDMVIKNADGSLTTQSIYLGKERIPESGGGLTYNQRKKEEKEKIIEEDKANIRQSIKNITGSDGYVDPNKMKLLRKEIADKAEDLLDWFDNAFPPSIMLNPEYEENQYLIEKNKWY